MRYSDDSGTVRTRWIDNPHCFYEWDHYEQGTYTLSIILSCHQPYRSHLHQGHPWTAYNTSKSAVLQMARSLACELGEQNIRVNSLSPGHIRTKMTVGYLDSQPALGGSHLLVIPTSISIHSDIGGTCREEMVRC